MQGKSSKLEYGALAAYDLCRDLMPYGPVSVPFVDRAIDSIMSMHLGHVYLGPGLMTWVVAGSGRIEGEGGIACRNTGR